MKTWHFLSEDKRTRKDGHGDSRGVLVTPGLILKCDPSKLVPCEYGLHASVKALDALSYAPGPIICRVELSGKILEHQGNKHVAQCREVLWMADATNTLHEFACWAAEQTLYLFEKEYPDDKRPRLAIEAKCKWLNGEITDDGLDAARSAAESAARSAAESARSAAWSARSAARSAAESAWSAARSAAESAWSAARSAQEKQLTKMLTRLK